MFKFITYFIMPIRDWIATDAGQALKIALGIWLVALMLCSASVATVVVFAQP